MIEDLELFLFSVSFGYLGLVCFINERSLYHLPETLSLGVSPLRAQRKGEDWGGSLQNLTVLLVWHLTPALSHTNPVTPELLEDSVFRE